MKQRRLYLDTSVISYLRQTDVPDKVQDTCLFWERVVAGEFAVYLSTTTLEELGACPEPRRGELFDLLAGVNYNVIDADTPEVQFWVDHIKQLAILPASSELDAMHLASAIAAGCNTVVSWNFKHMVNQRTAVGIRVLLWAESGEYINICTPSMLLERG